MILMARPLVLGRKKQSIIAKRISTMVGFKTEHVVIQGSLSIEAWKEVRSDLEPIFSGNMVFKVH